MSLINDFLSLIYPRYCEACSELLYGHEKGLCNDCVLNLPRNSGSGQPSRELELVFAGRVPVQKALSFYVYRKCGRVQRLLHAIKYHGRKDLGELVGQLYASELNAGNVLDDVDVIIPIPLHRKKLSTRGYNQSEWFAKGIATGCSLPMNTALLERTTETSTQTKKKKYQRWENVEGIFNVKDAEALKGKHVLLVDDVITTGATIEAAWLALKNTGDIRVSVASMAFASKN
jgi:ComF family protein